MGFDGSHDGPVISLCPWVRWSVPWHVIQCLCGIHSLLDVGGVFIRGAGTRYRGTWVVVVCLGDVSGYGLLRYLSAFDFYIRCRGLLSWGRDGADRPVLCSPMQLVLYGLGVEGVVNRALHLRVLTHDGYFKCQFLS